LLILQHQRLRQHLLVVAEHPRQYQRLRQLQHQQAVVVLTTVLVTAIKMRLVAVVVTIMLKTQTMKTAKSVASVDITTVDIAIN
jgi:hypothetical protein